jgi:hypothetical protein
VEVVDGSVATGIASTCSGTLDYPATQDQAYTLRLTAWDNVANRSVQEQTVTVSSVTKYDLSDHLASMVWYTGIYLASVWMNMRQRKECIGMTGCPIQTAIFRQR